jgi:metal-dependent HD superfamily phosphatase/phosphodiesterase
MKLNIPVQDNEKLKTLLERVKKDVRLEKMLECANITAIDRMGMSDHGPIHMTIVANIAMKILRNLIGAGVVPSIVKDHDLTNQDAEVVVFLAAVLHDLGHVVHRNEHHIHSIPLALEFLGPLLDGVYDEKDAAIITSEVLHAIVAHDAHASALTVEAGVLRVSDALDMKKGRARIPFKVGTVNIHSVSAMSIEEIEISKGEKPVEIRIKMSNSAGIFQLDNLLGNKFKGSGLEEYITITAQIEGEEKKILDSFDVK